jgi:hypothetical protein
VAGYTAIVADEDWLRARICKPFKEPRNRFPARRAGTTSLFDVPTSQGGGIDSLESLPGLLKLLQIRARVRVSQLVESCVESSVGVPGVVRLQVGAGVD